MLAVMCILTVIVTAQAVLMIRYRRRLHMIEDRVELMELERPLKQVREEAIATRVSQILQAQNERF